MKILFITNIPTPYTLNFLNEFDKLVDLDIIFERSNSKERDESWSKLNYKGLNVRILKGIPYKSDMAFAPQILLRLKRKYDFVIVSNLLTPSGIFAILWMKIIGLSYIVISEGGFSKSQKNIKEKIKRKIISNAILCFSGSPFAYDFYKYYGATENRIMSYPFTSLHNQDILCDLPPLKLVTSIKSEFDIKYSKVIISVGRIIHQKGFDILLKLAKELKDTGVYIIGGKANLELLELKNKLDLNNVHFIDFISKDNLDKYFLISDLFVLATRKDEYGLVINEAMAKGLPIVSTDMCGAALELVENMINGFIVPVNNLLELEIKVKMILGNKSLRDKMATESLKKIRKYTVENMSARIYECLLQVHLNQAE